MRTEEEFTFDFVETVVLDVLDADAFRLENFAFASSHDLIIGSLYFNYRGGHQRIRLTHKDGPKVGTYRTGGEWYFPATASWPHGEQRLDTQAVDNWIQGLSEMDKNPVKGHRIIEYWRDNANKIVGRHPSRGVVTIPEITQNDIDVIYNLITALDDTTLSAEQKNDALRQAIVDNNLSSVLRQ